MQLTPGVGTVNLTGTRRRRAAGWKRVVRELRNLIFTAETHLNFTATTHTAWTATSDEKPWETTSDAR